MQQPETRRGAFLQACAVRECRRIDAGSCGQRSAKGCCDGREKRAAQHVSETRSLSDSVL
eukprot:674046-Rhodomonas_salina.3